MKIVVGLAFLSVLLVFGCAQVADYAKANDYNEKCLQKYQSGDYSGAEEDCTKSIELSPHIAAYINRGNVRMELKDYEGSLQDSEKVVALDPNDPNGYAGRCVSKLYLKRFSEALPDCDRANGLDPNNADTLSIRAEVKYRMGDLAGAKADMDKAHSLDSSFPDYENAKAFFDEPI